MSYKYLKNCKSEKHESNTEMGTSRAWKIPLQYSNINITFRAHILITWKFSIYFLSLKYTAVFLWRQRTHTVKKVPMDISYHDA